MLIRRLCSFTITVIIIKLSESLPPHFDGIYKNLIDGKGLYSPSDKVVILNATNFKGIVSGTNNSWVVEFYNSWCGHCFAFAPKWKALAADISGWKKVVKLAVIDCSVDENSPVCRDYEIMGYPTLKFFPSHSPPSASGIELEVPTGGKPLDLARSIVGILRKEQLEGRGMNWPNLNPFRSSDLGSLTSGSARYVFIVFEDENSAIGTQLILDLSNVDGVEIRTALSDNEALARTMGVRQFPSIVYLSHGEDHAELLHPDNPTRESYRDAVAAFLEAKGFTVDKPEPPMLPSEIPMPDMGQLMQLHNAKLQLKAIKEQGDIVFLADLEGALRYMLLHEVPSRKVIKGEEMAALKRLLDVLVKYFPAGEAGIAYLRELRDKVKESGEEIRGIRFKALGREIGGGLNAVLATENHWLGCRGSEPHLRGYPCGVWTLFHFLTISSIRATDPLEVLGAMLGYITHFFGCTECSKHFQEMAGRSMRAKATDAEQAAIWLWSAHNEVNQRLSGADTDDPEFPKQQYPSVAHCPKCRDAAGRWSEHVVLAYLKNKYHQDSLSYQGSNTRVHIISQPGKPQENHHAVSSADVSSSKFGRYFNSLDISICIALYALSAIICAVVCWKFILRRHYRRKAF